MPRPHHEGQLEMSVHAYLWMAGSLDSQAPALLPLLTPLVQLDLPPPQAHPASQALPPVGSAHHQSQLLQLQTASVSEALRTAIVTSKTDRGYRDLPTGR